MVRASTMIKITIILLTFAVLFSILGNTTGSEITKTLSMVGYYGSSISFVIAIAKFLFRS
ncbi:MAG: hypothetical protein ACRCZR_05805 [Cetobacterium sp.]|uniref:hypothetical protein n=1 Tax=Cetobacterium sp. TaxID=2071632 RepID=UPI003EE7924A